MNAKTEAFLTPAAAQAWSEVGKHRTHESAELHVLGEAAYTDDIREAYGTLHAALGLSQKAHARIVHMDLGPVRSARGVVAVYTAADIRGTNDCGPIIHDDPILSEGLVEYVGQPIFDLARHESTRPDGTRETFAVGGRVAYALAPVYTDDGGHLNGVGRRVMASHMVRFAAAALESRS